MKRYYNANINSITFTKTHFSGMTEIFQWLSTTSFDFVPTLNSEDFQQFMDLAYKSDPSSPFECRGRVILHGIGFETLLSVDPDSHIDGLETDLLEFLFTYQGKPLPLHELVGHFSCLIINESGMLSHTDTDLLNAAFILSMTLRVNEYNLKPHKSAYFDGELDFGLCKELLKTIQDLFPNLSFDSKMNMSGYFKYEGERCELKLRSEAFLQQVTPFSLSAGDRRLMPQSFYFGFEIPVLDEAALENMLISISKPVYVAELFLGFIFVLEDKEGIPSSYSIEYTLFKESPVEPVFFSNCSRYYFTPHSVPPDDSFLCGLLEIPPGHFLNYITNRTSFMEYEAKTLTIALYCLFDQDTQNYEVEGIYFRLIRQRRQHYSFDYLYNFNGITEGYLNENCIQAYNCQEIIYYDSVIMEERRSYDEPQSALQTPDWHFPFFPGTVIRFAPESQAFRIEIAPPMGTSLNFPDLAANDMDPGFSLLPSKFPLRITDFLIEGNLLNQEARIALSVDPSALLAFTAGKLVFSVSELSGVMNYSPQNTGIAIRGVLRFKLETEFALYLSALYEASGGHPLWIFEAGLGEGHIPLFELVNHITGWHLTLALSITALNIRYATDGGYLFDCAISTHFPLFGEQMTIAVRGRIEKTALQEKPEVLLTGLIEIQYFLFTAQIRLLPDNSREYFFSVKFDTLTVEALYETNHAYLRSRISAEESGGVLTIILKNITIGGILTALMKVLRPNVNFKLPKPWDILHRIGFPEIHILFDTVTKNISVTLPLNIDLLILQIQEVGFTYIREQQEDEPKFNIILKYRSLLYNSVKETGNGGQRENSGPQEADSSYYIWDAFHQSAPDPLSGQETKKFRLQYFGLGRHIELGLKAAPDQPIFGLLDICRSHMREASALPSKTYSASYDWFIGARFTVLEFLEVGLLFYEPVLYGIQAKVLNNKIVPLKGLDLTIYYRKVTESIGLFYLNVCLPDSIRNMDFGALSVTLPSIEIWLYTNGNFKVNFGFPANHDFSLSFALSYGIFSGRGGFYFGVLNGDTSQNVPAVTNGYFDPVVELGIGISISIVKKLSLGILKLAAYLELSAMFEGVFARFLSSDGQTEAVYYKCSGTLVIAGELSGKINFFILQAGFRLYARASVTAVLESGKETEVSIEAHFSVSAYVKIWIIKISFHFSYTYRDTFLLGSPSPVPWKTGPALSGGRHNPVFSGAVQHSPLRYDWTPVSVYPKPAEATVWLLPFFTMENRAAVWRLTPGLRNDAPENILLQKAGTAAGQPKIALLASYDKQVICTFSEILCTWVLQAQKRTVQEEISKDELKALLEALTPECAGFTISNLNRILELNLRLRFESAAFSVTDKRRTQTELQHEGESSRVPMPLPTFLTLTWSALQPDESYRLESYRLSEQPMAEKLFCEYLLLVTKSGLQAGLSRFQEDKEPVFVDALIASILEQSETVSGMVSRFLLSGSRPDGRALYEAAWQEFPGLSAAGRKAQQIVHRLFLKKETPADAGAENSRPESTVLKEELLCHTGWYSESDVTIEIAEGDLDYPKEPLSVSFREEPALLPSAVLEHRAVGLYDRQDIYREDTAVYSLWKPAGDIRMLETLIITAVRQTAGQIRTADTSLPYNRCLLLHLEIQRNRDTDLVYSIVNADEETRKQLTELIASGLTPKGFCLLLKKAVKKSEEVKPANAYYYDADAQNGLCLIRRNLSEITTAPPEHTRKTENGSREFCISFDNLKDAMALLLRMLLIGGEGHFLQIGNAPLAGELFDDDGHAAISLLIDMGEAPFASVICLDFDSVKAGEIPVINNAELPRQAVQTVEPDAYSFSFLLQNMDASYGQFVYKADGQASLPVSPEEKDGLKENESYYSHLFRLSPAAFSGPLLGGEPDPYTRVLPKNYDKEKTAEIQTADLCFGFCNITGNQIAENDFHRLSRPFSILYHDRLTLLTEIPETQVLYTFEPVANRRETSDADSAPDFESGLFGIRLCLRCSTRDKSYLSGRRKESRKLRNEQELSNGPVEEASDTYEGILKQIACVYYQYRCADVGISFSFAFGSYETAAVSLTAKQKEEFSHYLCRLYKYLSEPETEEIPEAITFSFTFSDPVPEKPDGILCLPIRFSAEIARDERYVDSSSPLQGIGRNSCLIPPCDDLENCSAAFESCIRRGKLLLRDGLYAAFFPKDCLNAQPAELRSLFYSIPPLSVHLMSRGSMKLSTVRARLSVADAAAKQTKEEGVSYFNIDLDVWALRFFHFYEKLFTAESLSRLQVEDSSSALEHLLLLKRDLARTAASRAESLFLSGEGTAARNRAAENALCDYLQTDLEKGLKASGCAVYKCTFRSGGYALDGSLDNASGMKKCKIADETEAVFIEAPENTGSADTLSMEQASYTFTHLEDRNNSHWYRFLRPFQQFEPYIRVNLNRCGNTPVVLPIPLCLYPDTPCLSGHRADSDCDDLYRPVWKYEILVECALTSQDHLHFILTPESAGKSDAGFSEDFFFALAQFIYNEDEYETLLFGTDPEYKKEELLTDFAVLTERIRDNWPRAALKNALETGLTLAAGFENSLLSCFFITAHRLPEGIELPLLVLTDAEGRSCSVKADRTTYKYSIDQKILEEGNLIIAPGEPFQLKLLFENIPLNICQGMSCGLYLKRNESFSLPLPDQEPLMVNPAFVYETAHVALAGSVHPALRFTQTVQAGAWSVANAISFIEAAVGYPKRLLTELFISLGQQTGCSGYYLFHPLTRKIPHAMTPQTLEEFLNYSQEQWANKTIAGRGGYCIRLQIRQYAGDAADPEKEVILMEIDSILFNL